MRQKKISQFPANRISINARKTKKPVPSVHITIANKDKGKVLGGVDYAVPLRENIGEIVFNILQEFSNRTGDLYKKVFHK